MNKDDKELIIITHEKMDEFIKKIDKLVYEYWDLLDGRIDKVVSEWAKDILFTYWDTFQKFQYTIEEAEFQQTRQLPLIKEIKGDTNE